MTNLIFDYDGTLHNSIKIYAPAFRKAYNYLIKKGLAKSKKFSDEEIARWLGFTAKDMWNRFMPKLSREEQYNCSNIIGNEMLDLINAGKAELYPNTRLILHELRSKGYNLIFLSNCKRSYMNAHRNQFQLDDFFAAYYCSEEFDFIPKHQIFNCFKEEWDGEFIVIGDRFQDIKIATKNNLTSIGCCYGYGTTNEIKDATYIIKELSEIIYYIGNDTLS